MSGKRSVCGNCGSTQGPFQRILVGTRKNGHWIVVCKSRIVRVGDTTIDVGTNECSTRAEKARGGGPAPTFA